MKSNHIDHIDHHSTLRDAIERQIWSSAFTATLRAGLDAGVGTTAALATARSVAEEALETYREAAK